MHHDATMRTTVTLDRDVEILLRNEARRRGAPFKQVLNDAIRAGLRRRKASTERFQALTFDMGAPKVDLTKALALAAELEDEEIIRRHQRGL
jgi:SpoVK/Ycf46/Vps4 family AAA+-type ATPase